MKIRLTLRASRDIDGVYRFLVVKSPQTAQRVEDFIRSTIEGLVDFPELGVPTKLQDVRRMPLVRFPYTVFYEVNRTEETIDILCVIASARIRNLDQVPNED